MSAAEVRRNVLELDETKLLLETGRLAGSLTPEEISTSLGELELDAAQLDDFYRALEELRIDVVDGPDAEEEEIPESREVSTRLAAALPQGRRQGRAAHRRAGGRAREADRAR